jgi:hypothetical protein
MGEILTKEDRRAQYLKNVNARVVGRTKRKPRGGRVVKKERQKHKVVYNPQMCSAAISTAIATLANVQGIRLDDKTMNRIENLGALFLAAKDCTTVTGFLATLFLYLKTEYNKSVANTVSEYLAGVLDAEFNPQLGEFGVKSDKEKPKWLSLLKGLQENWTLIVRNDGFKKISQVMSVCIALGLCDAAHLDFKIGGMKVFSSTAFTKQATAFDLIDAAFETIVYFAEGGYACFERGSIKPLLYGDMENEEFEESYSKCMRCHEYARCGNLMKYENITENDFEDLLARCIDKAARLKNSCKGSLRRIFYRES